jgi:hypothetical protein
MKSTSASFVHNEPNYYDESDFTWWGKCHCCSGMNHCAWDRENYLHKICINCATKYQQNLMENFWKYRSWFPKER